MVRYSKRRKLHFVQANLVLIFDLCQPAEKKSEPKKVEPKTDPQDKNKVSGLEGAGPKVGVAYGN